MSHVKTVMTQGVDLILPPRCPVNGEMVDAQGMISSAAWRDLNFVSDPKCGRCGVPFDFDNLEEEEVGQCMACIDHPPAYDLARAALVYNDASRNLILGFKHGDKTHMVQSFVPWLMRSGSDILHGADAIVPVPLHRSRLLLRRYNQAALIAQELAKETGIHHIPMGVRRVRATPSQGHLKSDERRKNVRKAFIVPLAYQSELRGKVVVLIDDVYTTGATVQECARALKKIGVKEVRVLTLARVLRH